MIKIVKIVLINSKKMLKINKKGKLEGAMLQVRGLVTNTDRVAFDVYVLSATAQENLEPGTP